MSGQPGMPGMPGMPGKKRVIPERLVMKNRNSALLYFGISIIALRFILPAVAEPLSEYAEPVTKWLSRKLGNE